MTIDDLALLTITDLTRGYQAGTIDPVDVMQVTLEHARHVNPALHALYDVRAEPAITEATAARRRYRDGAPLGPLDGVPVTIKDSIHAVGMRWHHGSAAHDEGIVAAVDAPPAQRLRSAGAIIWAKCTMPDYGLSASGVSSLHGTIRNPWDLAMSPGGSSAGAGASLAAGVGMASVGSDIAGSVRLPAAHCGLAALKPTQGMIAHTPASDVRSAGPMSRHVPDLRVLLHVLGGVHPDDRFSVPVVDAPGTPVAGMRIGVCADFGFGPPVEPIILRVLADAAAALSDLGAEVVSIDSHPYDFDAYIPMDDSFRLRGWREYASCTHPDATPAALVEWLRPAGAWDQGRIGEMEAGLARGVVQTNALLAPFDAVLTPVLPMVAFPATRLGPDESMPLRHCTFTAPFNQSGHPAVALRGGFDASGMPIGLQLAGARFADTMLIDLAEQLTERLGTQGSTTAWPVHPHPGGGS